MPGAAERISSLRARYNEVTSSIAQYEGLISEQALQLRGRNRPVSLLDDDVEVEVPQRGMADVNNSQRLTAEDLKQEEARVKELEQKKRSLEQRVIGMDKDLGGLLR